MGGLPPADYLLILRHLVVTIPFHTAIRRTQFHSNKHEPTYIKTEVLSSLISSSFRSKSHDTSPCYLVGFSRDKSLERGLGRRPKRTSISTSLFYYQSTIFSMPISRGKISQLHYKSITSAISTICPVHYLLTVRHSTASLQKLLPLSSNRDASVTTTLAWTTFPKLESPLPDDLNKLTLFAYARGVHNTPS